MKIIIYISILLLIVTLGLSAQQTVRYDLFIKDTTVNYTGTRVDAISITRTHSLLYRR